MSDRICFSDRLSFIEAAELLSVKKSTLYQWTHKRTIPHYKIGKFLYFSRKELEQWFAEHRIAPRGRE